VDDDLFGRGRLAAASRGVDHAALQGPEAGPSSEPRAHHLQSRWASPLSETRRGGEFGKAVHRQIGGGVS
jgi:hypothetical protein